MLQACGAIVMNEYYWLCGYEIAPGSVVGAGAWGRFLAGTYLDDPRRAGMVAKELVYERVRREGFGGLPSRWQSIFLVASLLDAIHLRDRFFRAGDFVYRVELIDRLPVFAGDIELATLTGKESFSEIIELAKKYWQGTGGTFREYLTTSRIRILEVCSPADRWTPSTMVMG